MDDASSEKQNVEPPVFITPREIEVLKLVAREYTNSEIANELHIKLRTVDAHKRNLIKKLKVKNVVGLVKYAFKNGYVD